MAGNKFGLEQVLTYRREMEKLRKQELAVAKEGLYQATLKLESEEQRVELLTREFRYCQQQMESVDDMRLYSDFFARKREEIKQQKARVEHLDLVMNEKRSDLLEASKEKKVLESLKDKKAFEFRQGMAIRERNFLDEISIQKKVRLK